MNKNKETAPMIHDYGKTYPIREDSALRTPAELLALLGWKLGDECVYQLDFSDPTNKKLIVSVKSNGQRNQNQ